ncbi:hypothetical protein P8452_40989 [Trifolium repens]|nr:hypothetical protein P8452_40989 [Trifolium repens]
MDLKLTHLGRLSPCSELPLHQILVVQRLRLGHHQLQLLVDHQSLVRSLLLEVLALLLLKQVHLEVPPNHHNRHLEVTPNNHNQHLEAAFLVPRHLLALHPNQHLVQQALRLWCN